MICYNCTWCCLTGTKKSPGKPLNLSMDISSPKHKTDIQRFKTEVEELRKENDNLKNQLEVSSLHYHIYRTCRLDHIYVIIC